MYGWHLPEDHELYSVSLRSVCNITVSDLIKSVESLVMYPGVQPVELSSNIVHHVIPVQQDPLFSEDDISNVDQFPHQGYWRTRSCGVLLEHEGQCQTC